MKRNEPPPVFYCAECHRPRPLKQMAAKGSHIYDGKSICKKCAKGIPNYFGI